MQAGYREPAPEQAITVTIGPLRGFGLTIVVFMPMLMMLGGFVGMLIITFMQPRVTTGALDCRRTETTIQCHSWLEGGYSERTEGEDTEFAITTHSSRHGTNECLQARGKNVDCVNARGVDAKLRALRPGEKVSFDRSRPRDNVFLFLAPVFLVGGVLCVVVLVSVKRQRGQTSWVKVTPRALVFPDGQIPRVAPEGVRAVWLAKNCYGIQYGHEPRWQTVHSRFAYSGDLDPFAHALGDALAKIPLPR